ncbi:hypothetical protein ACFPM7_06740 [Actinokineospora guangxiensis]|uniref:Nitroreductase domain-containing protein n=1 Tax=Actinokineospora guangxiensis TaxID=1490288 RepID=A0ABW0EKA3_9PSEU
MTGWTSAQRRLITDAVAGAVAFDGPRPWDAVVGADRVEIIERNPRAGRDGTIACGAALAAAHLAVRVLGRAADWTWLPDPARPALVGRVEAGSARVASAAERARHRSLRARPGEPPAFSARPVDEVVLHGITRAARTAEALCRPVSAAEPLARLFPGSSEAHLVVLTEGDHRHDHLEAGMALLRAVLTAAAAGLACSWSTRVLGESTVRSGLARDCGGVPQIALRVGYPSPAFAQLRPRSVDLGVYRIPAGVAPGSAWQTSSARLRGVGGSGGAPSGA